MKIIKVEDPAVAPPEDTEPVGDPALAATLDVAPEAVASGDEDRTLACFLRSVETSTSAHPNPEEVAALRGVADRKESGNGDYPALIRTAAGRSGGQGGDEPERAAHAPKTVIRPLAARGADGTRDGTR